MWYIVILGFRCARNSNNNDLKYDPDHECDIVFTAGCQPNATLLAVSVRPIDTKDNADSIVSS